MSFVIVFSSCSVVSIFASIESAIQDKTDDAVLSNNEYAITEF